MNVIFFFCISFAIFFICLFYCYLLVFIILFCFYLLVFFLVHFVLLFLYLFFVSSPPHLEIGMWLHIWQVSTSRHWVIALSQMSSIIPPNCCWYTGAQYSSKPALRRANEPLAGDFSPNQACRRTRPSHTTQALCPHRLPGARGLRQEHDHGGGPDGRRHSRGGGHRRPHAPDPGASAVGAPGGGQASSVSGGQRLQDGDGSIELTGSEMYNASCQLCLSGCHMLNPPGAFILSGRTYGDTQVPPWGKVGDVVWVGLKG